MKRIAMGIAAAAVLFGASDVSAQDFQVVVHADAGLTEISSSDLSNIFQKKARSLPSGEGANPVDQDDAGQEQRDQHGSEQHQLFSCRKRGIALVQTGSQREKFQ